MKILKQVVAAIILVAFSFSNISFASEPNSFKLAAPSSFSSFEGPEFRESAQIQAGIRNALKQLTSFDETAIRALGTKEFTENSVFGKKVRASIHFQEAQECLIEGTQVHTESGSYAFRAATRAGTTYYCLISKTAAAYKVSVVPERVMNEALEKGVVKFTHESVNEKDQKVIGLYLEHEITSKNNVAIDEWIRRKMEAGEYMVDGETASRQRILYGNSKYYHYPEWRYLELLESCKRLLGNLGVAPKNTKRIYDSFASVPLVLIPYEVSSENPDLPVITDHATGKKVFVHAHSSPFARYVFLPYSNFHYEFTYNTITIDKWLRHEMGASCGLKAKLEQRGSYYEFENVLDVAYRILIGSGRGLENARKFLADANVDIANLAPVDLLDLELRNDYAAGVTNISAESRFKRWMSLVVAAFLGASITPNITAAIDDMKPLTERPQYKRIFDLIAIGDWDGLIEMGTPAVDLLIKSTGENNNKYIRSSAILALGHMKAPQAAEPLVKLLGDDQYINHYVTKALGRMGASAVKPLMKALNRGTENTRILAAGILGEIKDPQAVDSLIKASSDKYLRVRLAAIRALGETGAVQAIDALRLRSNDANEDVQKAVREAIEKIQNANGRHPAKPQYRVTHPDPNLLIAAGVEDQSSLSAKEPAVDVEKLIKKLKDGEPDELQSVIEALGRSGDKRAVQPLIEILKGKDKSTLSVAGKAMDAMNRAAAAVSLGMLGDWQAKRPLMEALKDEDDFIRLAAAEALGELKVIEAIPDLTKISKEDPKPRVRNAAEEAIEKIKASKEEPKKSSALPISAGRIITAAGDSQAPVDKVSRILWDAATGVISNDKAKEELAKAMPVMDVPHYQRDAAYDILIAQASTVVVVLKVKRNTKYAAPSDEDVRAIAAKIKEAGIEVFVPKSQFPGNTVANYRRAIESMGGRLIVYQNVDDLQGLISNPDKSIIMTSGITMNDMATLEAIKKQNLNLRVMNFECREDLGDMDSNTLDNYEADILGILLVSRIITPEDFRDEGSPTYRLLAHLLEDYMPKGIMVRDYIEGVVTSAARLIKAILKALSIEVYKAKEMRQVRPATAALWSA